RDAQSPLAPPLLDSGRASGIRLDVDGAHRGGWGERPRVLHGADDPAVNVADQDQDRVLEAWRLLQALQRQLARDLLVMAMHDDEDRHEDRDDDDDDPGALQ